MYCGRDFDLMDAGYESDVFTLDFVNDLNAGESISTVVFSIAVMQGIDPTPIARLSGSPSISTTRVSQAVDVRAAPSGVLYRLQATIATNQRAAISLWSHFWSRSPA